MLIFPHPLEKLLVYSMFLLETIQNTCCRCCIYDNVCFNYNYLFPFIISKATCAIIKPNFDSVSMDKYWRTLFQMYVHVQLESQ
jgi:hypothetical protein